MKKIFAISMMLIIPTVAHAETTEIFALVSCMQFYKVDSGWGPIQGCRLNGDASAQLYNSLEECQRTADYANQTSAKSSTNRVLFSCYKRSVPVWTESGSSTRTEAKEPTENLSEFEKYVRALGKAK
jgi:hypothetical protein